MSNITAKLFATTIVCALLNVLPASAQQPVSRMRGVIESVEGSTVTIKSRDGSSVKLATPDNVQVMGVAKIPLSDIKPSSYIGVAAMPQEDGSQKALSVHLFPESMRGAAEGFRAWDLRPNSTMTNAAVDQMVTANDGSKLTLKYKDGEKTIIVTPETAIVALVPGEKSELKAGAKIIAFVTKKDDGSFDAARFFVGRDGIAPPM
jgi:hypothetical protein